MLPLIALLNALKIPDALHARIGSLLAPIGIEFHKDMCLLLGRFSPERLDRFVELWSNVGARMQSPFVAFIVTGDDPEGAFLKYLDENKDCQEAVDLAFAAHVDSLHDLGKSLAVAERVLADRQPAEHKASDFATSLLSETKRAKVALESAQVSLESIAASEPANTSLEPVLHNVQAALTAVDETEKGLEVLVGIDG